MISGPQIKAARALLGIDQRALAEMADLSLPTIQRMESHEEQVRGHVDSLVKIVDCLRLAGIELIANQGDSVGRGCGVRLL